jgi:hypothetical protein
VSRPEAQGTRPPDEAAPERQPFPWDAFAIGARSMGSTVIGTFCWGLVTGVALVEGGLSAVADGSDPEPDLEPVATALDAVGLTALVVPDRQRWQRRDGVVVIPFR